MLDPTSVGGCLGLLLMFFSIPCGSSSGKHKYRRKGKGQTLGNKTKQENRHQSKNSLLRSLRPCGTPPQKEKHNKKQFSPLVPGETFPPRFRVFGKAWLDKLIEYKNLASVEERQKTCDRTKNRRSFGKNACGNF